MKWITYQALNKENGKCRFKQDKSGIFTQEIKKHRPSKKLLLHKYPLELYAEVPNTNQSRASQQGIGNKLGQT